MLKANKLYFNLIKLVVVIIGCLAGIKSEAQGLMFSSNDSLVAKRTSYSVFSSADVTFSKRLEISFDLKLWDKIHLGYIFNVSDKDNNSYSLSYINTNHTGYLNLNIDRVSNKLSIPLQQYQLEKRNWIRIKVDFDLANKAVILSVDNKSYKATGFTFASELPGKIIFGKNQYYTEVPNMAIRNLLISDNSSRYFFPLNEWRGNLVHDNDGTAVGRVENPIWLINDSYFWKPMFTHVFNQVAGLNFDTLGQRLFIYQKDSLLIYNLTDNSSAAIKYKNQLPVPMVLGKSIFNAWQNKCYVYEAFDVRPGFPSIAALDMRDLSWQPIGKAVFSSQRHHHNVFYNPAQDSIFLFGGYGAFKYYNTFFKYNQQADKWEQVSFKGDRISPRFFAAVGSFSNDEVLLFGGYGNDSGNQIIGGKQFYDLYRINLKTHTVKRCWVIQPAERFVPANNLILSKDKKYFYALCYPHEVAKTSLRLYKFSVKDGSYEIVGAPIPVTSEKIETDINLFYNEKTAQFFCAIQEYTNPLHSTVRVYGLSAPPVSSAAYLQSLSVKKNGLPGWFWAIVAGGTGLGILAFLIFVKRRQSTGQAAVAVSETGGRIVENARFAKMQNAAYLLGEFTVYDNEGKDITYLFSPKIKQLFLLLLLNSKEGKGVASKRISQILWPDKDVAKTKNLRGVTFNHLRNSIGGLDGIQLSFVNDSYIFTIEEPFFCDYFSLSNHIKDIYNNDCRSLIKRGAFLVDMPDAWLDDFKQGYEETILSALVPQLDTLYKEKKFKDILELTRLILVVDPFNDEAFRYELKSIRMLKGIEHSKKIYDQFSLEYSKSLGEEYPTSFDKVLL
jgi:DNA-binding SARP family transcriptional activator